MNVVYLVLIGLALTVIELLIGGTRLLFSLPSYGILAVAALLSLVDLRRPKIAPGALCVLSSALFFGYLLARALASPVVYLAWADEFAILGALIVYLLTACYLTDPRRRLWLLAVLLGIAGVHLFVGARQFSEDNGYMLFGFLRSTQYLGRASGQYICPDHLAGFLEVVACLTIAMTFWSRCRPWLKLLFGYCALCCVAGLLITASRGGALGFAAGLGVLTVLGLCRAAAGGAGVLRILLTIVIAVTLLGGGVYATLAYSPSLQARARILLDKKDIRLRLWPAAIREFHDAPVFGTGSGTYLYYGRMYRDVTVQADPIRPHSDYLELLAEYGAVGAVGFLLFLGAHLRWGARAFRHVSLSAAGTGGSNAAAWNLGAHWQRWPVWPCIRWWISTCTSRPTRCSWHSSSACWLTPGRGLPPVRPAAGALSAVATSWPRLALPALGHLDSGDGAMPRLARRVFCRTGARRVARPPQRRSP